MALFDLSAAVLSTSSSYAVTRTPKRTYAHGRAAPGTPSTVTVRAMVAPVTGAELERVTQGREVDAVIQVFSVDPLYSGTAAHEADVIDVGGTLFEVQEVEDWTALGGFYRAVASRKD